MIKCDVLIQIDSLMPKLWLEVQGLLYQVPALLIVSTLKIRLVDDQKNVFYVICGQMKIQILSDIHLEFDGVSKFLPDIPVKSPILALLGLE